MPGTHLPQSRRAWPKRLPRKVRSDEGVLRTCAARMAAEPYSAQPSQRLGRSLKRGGPREPRSDKRPRPEGADHRPACAVANEVPVSTSGGQTLAWHQRISAGRTPKRLQHIEQFHLFQRPIIFAEAYSEPAPGLSAVRQGQLVVIVDYPFIRRHVKMVDVLPLVTKDGVEFCAKRSAMCTCRLRDLSDIGAAPLRLLPRRSSASLRFQAVDLERAPTFSCSAATVRSLFVKRGIYSGEERDLGKYLRVLAVKPSGADEHVQSTRAEGREHHVAVRHDRQYGLRFVNDLPLPRQLDCRPWRCLTCKRQGVHREWRVSFGDIRRACPDVLRCASTSTAKEQLFTKHFLLFSVELFEETLNARALRRGLVQYYTANSLALAGGMRGLWFLSSVPRALALRRILTLALEHYLPSVVAHQAQSIHVFSGSAIKHDGNWEMAQLIIVVRACEDIGEKRYMHPYTVLHAFTGIDGALLDPVSPGLDEAWPSIEAKLDILIDALMKNRMAAQLPQQAVPPLSHSTDSYGKHYKKIRTFYAKKFQAHVARVAADTAIGNARMVHTVAECPTEPSGDPMHDHFALRRLVTPAANDCRNLLADHKDIMARLSAEPLPVSAKGPFDLPRDLPQTADSLLRSAIEMPTFASSSLRDTRPECAAAVRTFLEQPRADQAQTWIKLFRATPPRLTMARIARLFDARLHPTLGFYNHRDAAAFKCEVRALVRWYRRGKRASRWRRGIARSVRPPCQVRGVRCAMTGKVRAHMRKLCKRLRVEGMMKWRQVALATREAGVPVQSGTVAVERLWSSLKSMMPPAARRVSLRWFSMLSLLMCLRYNFRHFNPTLPGAADEDPLMAQRMNTLCLVVEALSSDDGAGGLDHLSPLFDPFEEP